MDKATKALAQRVTNLEKIVHALRDAPGKQDETTTGNAHDVNREHNGLRGDASRSTDRAPAPRQSQDADKKWYRSFKWWKSRIQFLALMAGIGYAFVTYWQWRDLRQNFKDEQRAWIGFTTMGLASPRAGDGLSGEVKILNTGKTVALDITFVDGGIQTSWIGLDDARKIYKNTVKPSLVQVGVLFPTIDVNLPSHTLEPLTNEQAAAVIAGTLHVYLFGEIHYRDIFKEAHQTRYCGHYVPKTTRFEDCGTEAN